RKAKSPVTSAPTANERRPRSVRRGRSEDRPRRPPVPRRPGRARRRRGGPAGMPPGARRARPARGARHMTYAPVQRKKTGAEAPVRHRRSELPCTPDATPVGPLIRQLLAAVEADVKDRSYRRSPVGETVGRFIDSVTYGNAPKTAESYESPLARLARLHDDLDSVQEFCEQPELLERFLHVNW